MNELLTNIKGIIIAQIKADQTVNRISHEILNEYLDDVFVKSENKRKLNKDEKELLFQELSNYFIADINYDNDLILIERGVMIFDPKRHIDWNNENNKRFYWKKQREFLMRTLGKRTDNKNASEIINSIDFETSEILTQMENPLRLEFDSRGLVVGYVQSGKTANFTALISKSVDAGYRFIIVLAGVHDELRQQTQIRIDRELTGHNNLNLEGDFIEWNDLESPKRWRSLTAAGYLDGKETGEFSGKGIDKFKDEFLSTEKPVIAIVKKNVRIMDRLIKWIKNSEEIDRVGVPLLIIDDEADQASVDGNATKEDIDPTKTNARIRQIIELFKRSSYVGYTATPFANVFIKHDTEHENLGDDLYPRNFIHSLPEPTGYFGTKRIFNNQLDKYFVKQVSDTKVEKKELADRGNITSNLVQAIYSFIIGIALRNLRGQEKMPMSMMINVDHRVAKMNRIGEVIIDYLKILQRHFNENEIGTAYDSFIKDSMDLDNQLNSKNIFFSKSVLIDEVINIIKSDIIKVRVLNSSNEDKLDYAKEPGMKVIAVGGNKLSRGLTLEGLMTTFYLRESKQFDTLLQMGRWFGYRKGYEDLVRIYTSKILWSQFKDLAIVELEFRANIKEMKEEEPPATPKEFAIAVRQIQGLLPTAKNKLGAAILENNFGGSQVSVTRLALEKPEIIDNNFFVIKKTISNIQNSSSKFFRLKQGKYSSLLAKEVKIDFLKEFIKDFALSEDEKGGTLESFNKQDLINYLEKARIENFNVAIISLEKRDSQDIIQLPNNLEIIPVNRARLGISPVNGSYNIKGISDKLDRRVDLSVSAKNEYDGRTTPLLLLYFIDKDSKPKSGTWEELYKNISIRKKRNPVSYALIFPNIKEAPGVYKQNITK